MYSAMKKVVLKVSKCRQTNPYVCGPAALKILIEFSGNKITQKQIIKISKPTPKEGTPPRRLISTAKKLRFKVFQKFNAKTKDVEKFISKGLPVMVVYQAWRGGHYSVIYGFDNKYFYVSDPAIDRGFRKIRKDLFVKRWHDYDAYGKLYKRWLMIIKR